MMTPYIRLFEAKAGEDPAKKNPKAGKKAGKKKKKVDLTPVLTNHLQWISNYDTDNYQISVNSLNEMMAGMMQYLKNNEAILTKTEQDARAEILNFLKKTVDNSKREAFKKNFKKKDVLARLSQMIWFLHSKKNFIPKLLKEPNWVKIAETAYIDSLQTTEEDEDSDTVSFDFGGVPETKTNTIRFKNLTAIQKEQLLDLLNIEKKYGYFKGQGINVKKMLKKSDAIAAMGVDVYYIYEESGKKFTVTLYPGKGIETGWTGNRKLLSRLRTKFDPRLWQSAQKFFEKLKNWFSSGIAGRDAGASELHMSVAYADKQKPDDFFKNLVSIVNDEYPETKEAIQQYGTAPEQEQEQQSQQKPATQPAPEKVQMPPASNKQKESFWRKYFLEADEGMNDLDKPPEQQQQQKAQQPQQQQQVRPQSSHPKISLPNVEMVVETIKKKLNKGGDKYD